MHPFPHRYHTTAQAAATGHVIVHGEGLPPMPTDAPPEFGGPPGHWSPETLLTAAVADCFVLSFRAVARAARLEWSALTVDVEGVLDRVDGVTRFTQFRVAPRLTIAAGADEAVARSTLERAEHICLVTNSLSSRTELVPTVERTVPA